MILPTKNRSGDFTSGICVGLLFAPLALLLEGGLPIVVWISMLGVVILINICCFWFGKSSERGPNKG